MQPRLSLFAQPLSGTEKICVFALDGSGYSHWLKRNLNLKSRDTDLSLFQRIFRTNHNSGNTCDLDLGTYRVGISARCPEGEFLFPDFPSGHGVLTFTYSTNTITVLCVSRLVSNYQLNAQFLYYITIYICYIIILDMFRAVPCSSSGGQIVLLQHLVLSLSVNGRTVRRLRADCSPLHTARHTVRPFTESDDTRGCNNTIWPPEDEHSTARNMSRIIM